MRSIYPNLITALNLLTGCVATVMAVQGLLTWVFWLLVLAACFDLLDGLVARAVRGQSEFGAQLDSLADMVSFGTVPGAVMYGLMYRAMQGDIWWPFFGFLITVFSAIRLAQFNISTNQSHDFIGLATPANALWIAALPMIQFRGEWGHAYLSNPYLLAILVVVSSFLLVSPWRLMAFKLHPGGSATEWWLKGGFVLMSAVIIAVFHFSSAPILLFLYLITSAVYSKVAVSNPSTS